MLVTCSGCRGRSVGLQLDGEGLCGHCHRVRHKAPLPVSQQAAARCHPARGVRLDAARNNLPDAGVAGDVSSLPETFSSLPVLTRTSRSRRTVRAGYACGLLRADAPEAQGNLPHTTVRPPYAYQPRACRGTYVYRGTPGYCRRSYSSPCRCMVKLQPGLRPSSAQAPP